MFIFSWMLVSLVSAVFIPNPCPNASLHSTHMVDTQVIELASVGVFGEVYFIYDDNATGIEVRVAGKGFQVQLTVDAGNSTTLFSFSLPNASSAPTSMTSTTNMPTPMTTNMPTPMTTPNMTTTNMPTPMTTTNMTTTTMAPSNMMTTETPTIMPTNLMSTTMAPSTMTSTTMMPTGLPTAPTAATVSKAPTSSTTQNNTESVNGGSSFAPSLAILFSLLFLVSSRCHFMFGLCVLLLAAPTFGEIVCDADHVVSITVIVPRSFQSKNLIIKTENTLAIGVIDPAPGISTPGDMGCAGCPTSPDVIPSFELEASASTSFFTGTVTGADPDAYWYLEGSNEQGNSSSGRRLLSALVQYGGTFQVAASGSYSVEIPLLCGDQVIKLVFTNNQGLFSRIYLMAATTVCNAFHATLTWDQIGTDWDMHFLAPNGVLFGTGDCYYGFKMAPHATLDIDCITQCTTENIVMSKANSGPGTYRLVLHNYGGSDFVTGRITITSALGGVPYARTINVDGLISGAKLLIADIDGQTGVITAVNAPYL